MHNGSSDPPLLRVRDLWAGYGAKPAIQSVALEIFGGVTGLIGSNGAGKSTALKAITGQLKVARGDVVFLGKNIVGRAPNFIASLGLIMVPEGGGLFPSMTVEDNLLMGAYMPRARSSCAESMRQVFELFPRLQERRSVPARRRSGGEQQMLAISRALIALPIMLILDEPSLGLSPSMTELVSAAIQRVADKGVAVLLCEQNAALALRISKYVYVMEHGEVVTEGRASELLQSAEVTRAYLGGVPEGARP